ncbi:MAG TPA: dihydroorotate dehydrogenase [Cyanobacteria bacterium UBA8530]|nr:dihydroorotate dehydrogenase [Cyanobacteria bacterium UBA8530]
MEIPTFKRVPRHLGLIPDGNRRWATRNGLPKEAGYEKGMNPGFEAFELCGELGIEELTIYGYTQDNTKRPAAQTRAFQKACVEVVQGIARMDAAILVVGNTESPLFPEELLSFARERRVFGKGSLRVNFLINYGWLWDLSKASGSHSLVNGLASREVSRIDLILRWGGRRRLSGFLPVQSVYADIFVFDDFWPEFRPEHLYEALSWYEVQDVTLGG